MSKPIDMSQVEHEDGHPELKNEGWCFMKSGKWFYKYSFSAEVGLEDAKLIDAFITDLKNKLKPRTSDG